MKSRDELFLSAVLDAMPSPVLVVDEDVRIIEANRAARPLLGEDATTFYMHRGGEILHCLSAESDSGCGQSPDCKECVIRNSVGEAFSDRKVVRRAAKMILKRNGEQRDIHLLVTTVPLIFAGRRYVILTLEDVNELVELRRLIPICANCKKVRDEQEYWDHVENYFRDHLDVDFTHGICPDCMRKLYPDIATNVLSRKSDG